MMASSSIVPRFFLVALAAILAAASYAGTSGPNIILVVADDMGWNDVGFHGSEILTPHLDQLADGGVRLDRFYVQPSCSPTRSELMTGRSAVSLGVVAPFSKHQPAGLPRSHRVLPEYLKDAGYQTLLVGKWHLGFRQRQYTPNARGFDHFYGHVTGGIGYWDHVHGGGLDWQRNGVTVREDGYATHLMRDEAVKLIRERDRERPFFLYLAFNAPHLPGEAPADSLAPYDHIENSDRRLHAGMVTELDDAIGAVRDVMLEQGITDSTLIWFMSDNGGLNPSTFPPIAVQYMSVLDDWLGARELPLRALEFARVNMLRGGADNHPLRGGKQTVYEGGIRVPSIIYWPGTLSPGVQAGMVTALDVLPTLLSAANLTPDAANLMGEDQWPALASGTTTKTTSYYATAFGNEAIVQFPWKLIETGSGDPQLYRLNEDPLEQRNLAGELPDQLQELQLALATVERGEPLNLPVWRVVSDPDFFGGAVDRPPWSELENLK